MQYLERELNPVSTLVDGLSIEIHGHPAVNLALVHNAVPLITCIEIVHLPDAHVVDVRSSVQLFGSDEQLSTHRVEVRDGPLRVGASPVWSDHLAIVPPVPHLHALNESHPATTSVTVSTLWNKDIHLTQRFAFSRTTNGLPHPTSSTPSPRSFSRTPAQSVRFSAPRRTCSDPLRCIRCSADIRRALNGPLRSQPASMKLCATRRFASSTRLRLSRTPDRRFGPAPRCSTSASAPASTSRSSTQRVLFVAELDVVKKRLANTKFTLNLHGTNQSANAIRSRREVSSTWTSDAGG